MTNYEFSLIINNLNYYFKNISKNGSTGKYYIDSKNKIFIKEDILYNKKFDTIKREALIYQLLIKHNMNWSLKLIDYKDNYLITEYLNNSKNIDKYNIPNDYKEQLNKIFSDMDKLNLRHNDLKLSDILVQDGKIIIIDFGWASINNCFSCGSKNITKKSMMHLTPNSKNDSFYISDRDIMSKLDDLYSKKLQII